MRDGILNKRLGSLLSMLEVAEVEVVVEVVGKDQQPPSPSTIIQGDEICTSRLFRSNAASAKIRTNAEKYLASAASSVELKFFAMVIRME